MARTTVKADPELAAAFARAAAGERVIVRRGDEAVALIPLDDLAYLEEVEREEDDVLAEVGREAWEEYVASGEVGVPLEQVRRELGLT